MCASLFESQQENKSLLLNVSSFDLNNEKLYNQVKKDYEDVRRCIIEKGFECLSGSMGELVQPRTKGAGHGTTSRAFYARTRFVSQILGILPEEIS